MEDTKGKGGLQKVLKMWKKSGRQEEEKGNVLFHDEKLHNV
jgi:hypothetical protein